MKTMTYLISLLLLTTAFAAGGVAVPEDAGDPFYTTDSNPQIPAGDCIDMQDGESCFVSWQVMATGEPSGPYIFTADAESDLEGVDPITSGDRLITIIAGGDGAGPVGSSESADYYGISEFGENQETGAGFTATDALNDVTAAEYFVKHSTAETPAVEDYGTGTAMVLNSVPGQEVDYVLDTNILYAALNAINPAGGDFRVYMHGKDAADNWGNLVQVTIAMATDESVPEDPGAGGTVDSVSGLVSITVDGAETGVSIVEYEGSNPTGVPMLGAMPFFFFEITCPGGGGGGTVTWDFTEAEIAPFSPQDVKLFHYDLGTWGELTKDKSISDLGGGNWQISVDTPSFSPFGGGAGAGASSGGGRTSAPAFEYVGVVALLALGTLSAVLMWRKKQVN